MGNEKPDVETLLSLWNQQQTYIDHLEASAGKTESSKDNKEASRREHLLVVS